MKKEIITWADYCRAAFALVPTWPRRSKWARGVQEYALIMLSRACDTYAHYTPFQPDKLKEFLLGGADSFEQLSSGGGVFPFTSEKIESILCPPSACGRLSISRLMECQSRAIMQAYIALRNDLNNIINN